ISMPGLPMKVGKSADMVWVRSTTLVKLLACVGLAVAAVAANPAAATPLKKRRRLKAARTVISHPATHMVSPSCRHTMLATVLRFCFAKWTLATGLLTQAVLSPRLSLQGISSVFDAHW